MKLFVVNLRGSSNVTDLSYNKSCVIANNTDEAYKIVRKYLDDRDYGVEEDRELLSVELIADEDEYTSVGTRLFVNWKAKGD